MVHDGFLGKDVGGDLDCSMWLVCIRYDLMEPVVLAVGGK